VNRGVTPPYVDLVLAFAIGEAVVETTAELRKWIPGDQIFEGNLYVPEGLQPGEYKVRVAMLDARTRKPAVKLAIEGLQADGWYDLGSVRVQ
jgi:hypothetical protein